MSYFMQRMLERQDGVEDLCLITNNNEEAVVRQLRTRLQRNKIYTNIAEVLIAVNPYCRLDIYGDAHLRKYQTASLSDTNPHIYGLAERAYRRMIDDHKPQAVIISGESGAGKTESAKLLLHYVSSVSGGSNRSQYIKEVILRCNPLLESFGNAKTVRNDNSSRFGKYLQIYFTDRGEPVGGVTSNFLLEKTRVTFQQKRERTFHIFYQLLAGGWQEIREEAQLGGPEDYAYTGQSGTVYANGINDAAMFQEVTLAMETIKIKPDEQWQIFSALAAILNIGNIELQGKDAPATLRKGSSYYVQMAAYLLGVDDKKLVKAITHKKVQMGGPKGEIVYIPQNADQSTQIRDALAKELYSKIFDLIVARINRVMHPKNYGRGKTIGILDIYGFEIFKNNSFEQFCINYVNEKLQQIFIELTIKGEQREYHSQGLPWRDVPFFDNQIVCTLIEGANPPGLMRVLDDTCRTLHAVDSRTMDDNYISRIQGTNIRNNPHLDVQGFGVFTIHHYAGDVVYNVDGFCFKNMDNLYQSVSALMLKSKNRFIKSLWKRSEDEANRMPSTSSKKIRQSAKDLVDALMRCQPHYIRCIKPNENKAPMTIVENRVVHQVRYLGMVQNIKVMKAGYSYRAPYEQFWNSFCMLLNGAQPGLYGVQAVSGVQQLCDYLSRQYPNDVPRNEWAFGKSKIFVSSPQTVFFLEEMREKALDPIGYAEKVRAHEEADRMAEAAERAIHNPGKKKKCSIM